MKRLIHIKETRRDGREWSSAHRMSDPEVAFDRAIIKAFGKNSYFSINHELTGKNSPEFTTEYAIYGQVAVLSGALRGNTITGTVSVSIDKN